MEFRASFSGVVHIIFAPVKAVLAIYANENQQGMFFDYEESDTSDGSGEEKWTTTDTSKEEDYIGKNDKKRRSHLRLVE